MFFENESNANAFLAPPDSKKSLITQAKAKGELITGIIVSARVPFENIPVIFDLGQPVSVSEANVSDFWENKLGGKRPMLCYFTVCRRGAVVK